MNGPSPLDNLDDPVHPDDEAEIWATRPSDLHQHQRELSPPSLLHPSPLSATSDSSVPVEVDPDTGNRRFTAQEKGKGRAARAPLVVEDSDSKDEVGVDEDYDDDSFEILGERPAGEKKKSVDEYELESADDGEVEDEVPEEGIGLEVEEHGIGSFCEHAPYFKFSLANIDHSVSHLFLPARASGYDRLVSYDI